MKRIGLFLIVLCSSQMAVRAAPRFALLRFEDVVKELPSYKHLETSVEEETDAIAKDPRAAKLKELTALMQAATDQFKKTDRATDPAVRQELADKIEMWRKEAEAINKDYQRFEREEQNRIRRKLLDETEMITKRVLAAASRIAADRGFDCLFECKGVSNTSLPVLLYAKHQLDITQDVLDAVLSEEKSQSGSTPPAPAPPPGQGASKPAPASPAPPATGGKKPDTPKP